MMRRKYRAMKGQALIVPALILIIILIALLSYLNIPLIKTGQITKDIEVRSEAHTMSNALDAAKLYMDTALEYSIYQACYDNLMNGGAPSSRKYQGYAVWSFAGSASDSVFDTVFNSSLESSIAKNLKLYRGSKAYAFLSDYHVNLPTYSEDNVFVNLDPQDPGWMFVTAFGEGNLNIQKTQDTGEYIRLEKDSTLQNQDERRIDCYGIYREGVGKYRALSSIVNDALAKLPPQITAAGQNDLEKQKSFDKQILAYRKAFDDTVRSGAHGLSEAGQDYDVTVYVYQADFKYTESGVSGDTHTLSHAPDVYVKFSITNIRDSQQFPVYDGKAVVMSPLTLEYVANPPG